MVIRTFHKGQKEKECIYFTIDTPIESVLYVVTPVSLVKGYRTFEKCLYGYNLSQKVQQFVEGKTRYQWEVDIVHM